MFKLLIVNNKVICVLLLIFSVSHSMITYGQSITEPKKLFVLINNNEVKVLFRGFGTEPWWNLYVLKDELLYADEENEVFLSYALLDQFKEGEYMQKLRYQTKNGDIHTLTITNKPTDDGMSEELHPFEVILDYGDSKRYGCGWSSDSSVETYPPQPPLEVEIFEDIEPAITGSDEINYNEVGIIEIVEPPIIVSKIVNNNSVDLDGVLPKPTVYFGGKSGGTIEKVRAIAANGIVARLENNPLNTSYKVVEFMLYTTKAGAQVKMRAKGNKLSSQMKAAIKYIKKGGILTFAEIKIKGPSGKVTTLDGSLTLTVI